MCLLSVNLAALIWKPQGLSRDCFIFTIVRNSVPNMLCTALLWISNPSILLGALFTNMLAVFPAQINPIITIFRWMYLSHSPQSTSSDPSIQSRSRSHFHVRVMQLPSLHWNSCSVQDLKQGNIIIIIIVHVVRKTTQPASARLNSRPHKRQY